MSNSLFRLLPNFFERYSDGGGYQNADLTRLGVGYFGPGIPLSESERSAAQERYKPDSNSDSRPNLHVMISFIS
jgi:hypothetical protein